MMIQERQRQQQRRRRRRRRMCAPILLSPALRHTITSSSTSFLLLLLMAAALVAFPPSASAQSILSPRDLERRLKNLTDDELEQICIDRGFELITDELDDETGLPVVSMHQDYIDAAIQCIQMEDIVANNLFNEEEQGEVPLPTKRSDRTKEMALEEDSNPHHSRYQNLQIMVDHMIPLPKPVKRLLGKLLIRLVNDGTELILFVRRQFDAIVGAIRDGITDARVVEQQQQRQQHDWQRRQRVEQDL